jgi:hypothetical protein
MFLISNVKSSNTVLICIILQHFLNFVTKYLNAWFTEGFMKILEYIVYILSKFNIAFSGLDYLALNDKND